MKNGVKKKDAAYIFELVDKFAGYGFNKSHAAAYALVSYHTAYLKANFREEFLAASMTLDMANTDKLAGFAAEARRTGIRIDAAVRERVRRRVRRRAGHRPERARGAIRYALAALKNIGEAAVETIVAERKSDGRLLRPVRLRPPSQSQGGQQARAGDVGGGRLPSTSWSRTVRSSTPTPRT